VFTLVQVVAMTARYGCCGHRWEDGFEQRYSAGICGPRRIRAARQQLAGEREWGAIPVHHGRSGSGAERGSDNVSDGKSQTTPGHQLIRRARLCPGRHQVRLLCPIRQQSTAGRRTWLLRCPWRVSSSLRISVSNRKIKIKKQTFMGEIRDLRRIYFQSPVTWNRVNALRKK